MESKSKSVEDLDLIRNIMERSTRFMSLSGLSGVFAGLAAITGSAVAYFLILKGNAGNEYLMSLDAEEMMRVRMQLVIDALIVLAFAIGISLLFSYRRTVKQGLKMWTPVSRRLLMNMFIPLVSGGFFILILYIDGFFGLIIPSMLIFYGLALVNAGRFTNIEVFYMGVSEIVTGLISALFPEIGLFLWMFGFGILHIVYGLVMYRKYEV